MGRRKGVKIEKKILFCMKCGKTYFTTKLPKRCNYCGKKLNSVGQIPYAKIK